MWISAGFVIFLGLAGFGIYKWISSSKHVLESESKAKQLIAEAELKTEKIIKDAELQGKDEVIKLRKEFEAESKERRAEITLLEKRLLQKEENLEERQKKIDAKESQLDEKTDYNEKLRKRLDSVYQQQVAALEKVAQMPKEEAKRLLMSHLERELKNDAAKMIRDIENQTRQVAQKRSREIIANAIQQTNMDHVVETTTSVVQLPSDEMKGRIIGREGRNIRTFETLTGVDLVIDDTPEAVVLSAFDPIRREIAKIALAELVKDGRIHPARVEEMVQKATQEVENVIKEKGEQTAQALNVQNVHPKLLELLGKLYYRTSYGQNNLQHAMEVSRLADLMARQLGVNNQLARRAGLLHDIGKALDFEQEGTHMELGAEVAKKYGESPEVINSIVSHHEGGEEPSTVESVLVKLADAISASRPGARRESLEAYIKRLEKLEKLAMSFEGIEKCYAVQAGREVRVMVKPDIIDDLASNKLAHDIAKKIEAELEYPGQIKVSVIRETRAQDVAR
ncbi:MAG: ribonuclease Y [Candidatus Margulisbacteria bacterium]|nr:ribonuclease Y [Candidatus Margulisiibacteriota bacterium]